MMRGEAIREHFVSVERIILYWYLLIHPSDQGSITFLVPYQFVLNLKIKWCTYIRYISLYTSTLTLNVTAVWCRRSWPTFQWWYCFHHQGDLSYLLSLPLCIFFRNVPLKLPFYPQHTSHLKLAGFIILAVRRHL